MIKKCIYFILGFSLFAFCGCSNAAERKAAEQEIQRLGEAKTDQAKLEIELLRITLAKRALFRGGLYDVPEGRRLDSLESDLRQLSNTVDITGLYINNVAYASDQFDHKGRFLGDHEKFDSTMHAVKKASDDAWEVSKYSISFSR